MESETATQSRGFLGSVKHFFGVQEDSGVQGICEALTYVPEFLPDTLELYEIFGDFSSVTADAELLTES